MDWTAVVAIVCLAISGPLCLCGVFCNAYKESWLQFWGLWGMAIWCFARIEQIAQRGHTDAWNLALYIGMAAYGVGTALKVLSHSRAGSCSGEDPEVGWQ